MYLTTWSPNETLFGVLESRKEWVCPPFNIYVAQEMAALVVKELWYGICTWQFFPLGCRCWMGSSPICTRPWCRCFCEHIEISGVLDEGFDNVIPVYIDNWKAVLTRYLYLQLLFLITNVPVKVNMYAGFDVFYRVCTSVAFTLLISLINSSNVCLKHVEKILRCAIFPGMHLSVFVLQ